MLQKNKLASLLIASATALLAQTAHAQILGYVDGVDGVEKPLQVIGWGCAAGRAQPIQIHVYAGGQYAQGGTLIAAGAANLSSEPAVANSCATSYGQYRFSFQLSSSVLSLYAGQRLYIYGVDPTGAVPSQLLNNSGKFKIPEVPAKRTVALYGDSIVRGQYFKNPVTLKCSASYAGDLSTPQSSPSSWPMATTLQTMLPWATVIDRSVSGLSMQEWVDGKKYNVDPSRNDPIVTLDNIQLKQPAAQMASDNASVVVFELGYNDVVQFFPQAHYPMLSADQKRGIIQSNLQNVVNQVVSMGKKPVVAGYINAAIKPADQVWCKWVDDAMIQELAKANISYQATASSNSVPFAYWHDVQFDGVQDIIDDVHPTYGYHTRLARALAKAINAALTQ